MEIKKRFHKSIRNPESVASVAKAILQTECQVDQDKEHFWVFGLTSRSKIVYIELVSLGTLTASLVHPREVFRLAEMKAVDSMIVAHNHPSGDPEPSGDDLKITRKIRDAGEIIGIKLVDHVVIGDGFYSFRDHGLI